ncbi:ABC transporter permease [Aliirhizobium cellulosilyticum]|uniref:Peptide/nickel transport system permease protein n=1 Tax=Aliirhizobium cellulosilyticum TaxID=393664 RepID=A0A7W6TF83_9HYPH|nr:ABC transporter permease [Rhizobium cellulosilyticum]MBB4349398.1 peptide/nickel transport system permease protein [Rhizobium cellulosilyticum]MBB4412380.1 peptide/nickel transport system permease protein [Rhizobium cellulosilyticum]MBB4447012.1 peptide/nickel transport system permease protein [Rhizobium cellulosilyticum]
MKKPILTLSYAIVFAVVAMAICSPILTSIDPNFVDPFNRNLSPLKPVNTAFLEDKSPRLAIFGTDALGRDIFARIVYGAQTSILIGVTVTVVSVLIGTLLGLICGSFKTADGIIMRIMDGLMAIPAILLAIALMTAIGTGIWTVILAITVVEIPRVVRVVRSVVLSVREEPYVEAAISLGVPTPRLLLRHILPNAVGPLTVIATFIMSAAILLEATLSFLGLGMPQNVPTWGNTIAEGRTLFQIYPHNIWIPALFLSLTVLGVNVIGDGMRDTLDPRNASRSR